MMLAQLSGMMAGLGIDTISFGSRKIHAAKRDGLKRLVGFGDRIEVGDVVEVSTLNKATNTWTTNPEPQRVFRLFKGDEGPEIQYRTIDDGPLYCRYCVPLASYVETESFRERFRKLSQAEVTSWFEQARVLSDGTHQLETFGSVTIEGGVPVKVARSAKHVHMALVVEVAGQLSGYDLAVARKYSDSGKLEAAVTKAARKQPPEV